MYVSHSIANVHDLAGRTGPELAEREPPPCPILSATGGGTSHGDVTHKVHPKQILCVSYASKTPFGLFYVSVGELFAA